MSQDEPSCADCIVFKEDGERLNGLLCAAEIVLDQIRRAIDPNYRVGDEPERPWLLKHGKEASASCLQEARFLSEEDEHNLHLLDQIHQPGCLGQWHVSCFGPCNCPKPIQMKNQRSSDASPSVYEEYVRTRDEVLEEAARVASDWTRVIPPSNKSGGIASGGEIAKSIRALKSQPRVDKARLKDHATAGRLLLLEEALRTISKWNQINPVPIGSDLPWLKRVVEDALAANENLKISPRGQPAHCGKGDDGASVCWATTPGGKCTCGCARCTNFPQRTEMARSERSGKAR